MYILFEQPTSKGVNSTHFQGAMNGQSCSHILLHFWSIIWNIKECVRRW